MVSRARPLIGHTAEFLRDPLPLFRRAYAEHGLIFRLSLLQADAVVVLGPEFSRWFFKETDGALSIRGGYPFFPKMFDDQFYLLAEPAEYRRQRKLMLPRFKPDAIRRSVGAMVHETVQLIERLGDAGEFDLVPTLGPLVMNIAAHAFLGRAFRETLGGTFFSLFRDFSGGMDPIFPLWLPLPHLIRSRRAKKALHTMLGAVIDERREAPVDPPDLIQSLVDASYEGGEPVPRHHIINFILLFVWAGHETTAGQISWALIDLLRNPAVLGAVRAEVDTYVPADPQGAVDSDFRALPTLDLALKETERMHPVASLLARKATRDVELGGHSIPEGHMVIASPGVSHALPEIYPEPDVFRPERHTADPIPYGLIGFGGGMHRCAGVHFAYLEMKVVLALLLRRYDIELLDRDPQPVKGPTTKWPDGVVRVAYRRRER